MAKKKSGKDMLRSAFERMNSPKSARKHNARKHRAMQPGINAGSGPGGRYTPGDEFGNKFGSTNARLGGTDSASMARYGTGNEGSSSAGDWAFNGKMARKGKKAAKPHLKPKGKAGRAQVKRIGRTYKTGGFKKIAAGAAKEYGSKKAGEKVAGAIFNKMAKGARKAKKNYAHKGHAHKSRKAMKSC